jgi:hypothetical protein
VILTFDRFIPEEKSPCYALDGKIGGSHERSGPSDDQENHSP